VRRQGGEAAEKTVRLGPKVTGAANTAPSPYARLLYDAQRIRAKRAREIERDQRGQGERTRLTSLPLDAPETPAQAKKEV
jgi:hypothetical protein